MAAVFTDYRHIWILFTVAKVMEKREKSKLFYRKIEFNTPISPPIVSSRIKPPNTQCYGAIAIIYSETDLRQPHSYFPQNERK